MILRNLCHNAAPPRPHVKTLARGVSDVEHTSRSRRPISAIAGRGRGACRGIALPGICATIRAPWRQSRSRAGAARRPGRRAAFRSAPGYAHGVQGPSGGYRGWSGATHSASSTADPRSRASGFNSAPDHRGWGDGAAQHTPWGAHYGWDHAWDPAGRWGWNAGGWGWRAGWGWGAGWSWNGVAIIGGPAALFLTPWIVFASPPLYVAPPPIVVGIPALIPPPVVAAAPPPPPAAAPPVAAAPPPPPVVAPEALLAAAAPPPIVILPPPAIIVATAPPALFFAPPFLAFGYFGIGFWGGGWGWHGWAWGGNGWAWRDPGPVAWQSHAWASRDATPSGWQSHGWAGHDPASHAGQSGGWGAHAVGFRPGPGFAAGRPAMAGAAVRAPGSGGGHAGAQPRGGYHER